MILLTEILSSEKPNLKFIENGLHHLISTTHLVADQIKNNIEEYKSNFNEHKFSNKIGSIKSFLGSGVFGAVFRLSDNKTFKLTLDHKEAPFLYKYCYQNNTPGFVVVDKMYTDQFGDSHCFYIVREQIKKISDSQKVNAVISDYKNGGRNLKYENDGIKNGVSFALQAMYNIDNDWRGTHSENVAIQNGKIVLYDGFSKKATPSNVNVEKF